MAIGIFSQAPLLQLSTEQANILRKEASEISLPYTDLQGRTIQLWKHKEIFAASITEQEKIYLVFGTKISNALQPQERDRALLERLEKGPLRTWQLSYLPDKGEISIWPWMVAAGKLGSQKDPPQKSYTQQKIDEHKGHLLNRELSAAQRENNNIPVYRTDGSVAKRSDGSPYDHVQEVRDSQAGLKNIIIRLKKELGTNDISPKETNRINREISEASKLLDFSEGYLKSLSHESHRNYKIAKDPQQPATKEFQETLQQTKLTASYNATHRGNPMPEKGCGGGEIGGVACSVDYIQGLFDDPDSLFEGEHFFCIPNLTGEQPPFTDLQLRQILRELAIGIYVHSTVPFFSLHFRQETADLFPVIHPAYKNTLVGRVIGMLDYFMKGYLNGGVFSEEFIDEWHKNPSWSNKSDSILDKMIDFEKHCYANLSDSDRHYDSVKTLHEKINQHGLFGKLEKELGSSSPTLSNFEGFKNSFRIIAKQNGFEKKDGLFVIDADFDVFYTIEPSAKYQTALHEHVRKYGQHPSSYQTIEAVYQLMAKKIHDHMVKMPLCRHYFAMLGVINFFSSYFSTLKNHRKVPSLPPCKKIDHKGCPSLFPHLPIISSEQESIRVNQRQIMWSFATEHRLALRKYFSELFDHLIKNNPISEKSKDFSIEELQSLQDLLHKAVKSHISELCSVPFRRFWEGNMQAGLDKISQKYAKDSFDYIFQQFESLVQSWIALGTRPRASKEDIIRDFVSSLKQIGSNEITSITPPFSYKAMLTSSENSREAIEKNKRVVGGCGMELTEQKIKPSRQAALLWENNWKTLLQLQPESLTMVNMENSLGAVFRLGLTEVPACLTDDYEWMESLLIPEDPTYLQTVEQRMELEACILSGDQTKFVRLARGANLGSMINANGASLLHTAAKMKDAFFTKHLLEKGLSPEARDSHGFYPIHYAAMAGAIDCLTCLYQKNPSSRARGYNRASPLTVAIQHSQLEAVSFLLKRGSQPTTLASGYTDLHCALHEGNREIISLVLGDQSITLACLNVCSEEGGTPLMLACELDSLEFVEQLLKMRANASLERKDGMTAIEIAARKKSLLILKVLINQASPSSRAIEFIAKQGTLEMVELFSKRESTTHMNPFARYKNRCGDNVLHLALGAGNVNVAHHVIHYPEGCALRSRNFTIPPHLTYYSDLLSDKNMEGNTPSDLAIFINAWGIVDKINRNKKIDLEKLLKADYNIFVKKQFESAKLTPSEIQSYALTALQAGNYMAINEVFKPKGVDLETIEGPNGWKALHYLAKADGIFLFKIEAARTKDFLIPLAAEGNKTLSYIAAEHGSHRVFFFLLEQMQKGDISLHNHFHDRHLFYAVIERGHFNTIKKTLSLYKDLANTPLDSHQTRPSHLAAKLGLEEVLEELATQGADLSAKDKSGKSLLHYAICAESEMSVSFLLKKGVSIEAMDLYEAASQDKVAILESLLSERFLQNELDEALFEAVCRCNIKAFTSLKAHGAAFNHRAATGWTPTLMASDQGQSDILEEILKNPPRDERKINGNNALHLTCAKGHANCARRLIEAGYSPQATNDQDQSPKHLGKNSPAVLDVLENRGVAFDSFALSFGQALQTDDPQKMKILFESPFRNDNIFIEYGGERVSGTPLHLLIRASQGKNIRQIIPDLLKELFIDPNLPDSTGETLAHLLVRADLSPVGIKKIDLTARNHKGQTPLHLAAACAEISICTELVNALDAKELNATDHMGRTPIFGAIEVGKEETLSLLLAKGADSGHRDNKLTTPLLLACDRGSLSIVRILIQNNADPNRTGTLHKIPPVHLSAQKKQNEITRYLLMHGARSDLLSGEGHHLLHYAVATGNIELIRLLAAKGISMDIRGPGGKLPKHQAALEGHIEILEELLYLQKDDADCSIDIPLELDSSNAKKEELAQINGATPLHLAALSGQTATVNWLLKHQANPGVTTEKGDNALHFAAQSSSALPLFKLLSPFPIAKDLKNQMNAIAETIRQNDLQGMIFLYQQGIPVNMAIAEKSTGLHLATLFGSLQCSAWLLQHSADPFDKDPQGKTAFEISAGASSAAQLQLLLDYEPLDIDETFRLGRTLLHVSCKAGSLLNAALLIQRGASLDKTDASGATPVDLAIKEKQKEVAHLLLACGANMTIKMTATEDAADFKEMRQLLTEFENVRQTFLEGDSKLHKAVRSGLPLAVRLLAQTEDLNQKNSAGKTPLDIATELGMKEIRLHLLRSKAISAAASL